MRVRTIATCALLATALGAPAATAAKKPKAGCHLTDPRGDAGPLGDPSVDIIGADLGTSSTYVVAVLAVAGAAPDASPGTALGREWAYGLTVNGVRLEFRRTDTLADQRSAVTVGGVAVPHTFRVTGNRLVWTARWPRPFTKPKPAVSDAGAETSVGGLPADSATWSCRR